MKVLILSGPNHGFEKSSPLIHEFLGTADDLDVVLKDNKDILADGLDAFDVCVFGTGFRFRFRLGCLRWSFTLRLLSYFGLPICLGTEKTWSC